MIQTVTSKDGTPIAYQRSGSGPAIVLVHGTLGVSKRWPVVPLLAVPTLLLLGEHIPPSLKKPTATLRAALPNSRIAVLPGQQHIAHYTAPELFAAEVVRFLDET